jgi:hypothetical protein
LALVECKECKIRVADSAIQCPQCGALYPARSDAELREEIRKFVRYTVRISASGILGLGILTVGGIPMISTNERIVESLVRMGWYFVLAAAAGLLVGEVANHLYKRHKE